MHGDGYAWGMGLGWLLMIVFWVFAVAGGILFVRWIASFGHGREREPGCADSALDILKKRYVRGEIGRDEYERIKKDIS